MRSETYKFLELWDLNNLFASTFCNGSGNRIMSAKTSPSVGIRRKKPKHLVNKPVPPKNGLIALRPNTRVVKCKYYVSQKQNGFNNKIQWYDISLTCIC